MRIVRLVSGSGVTLNHGVLYTCIFVQILNYCCFGTISFWRARFEVVSKRCVIIYLKVNNVFSFITTKMPFL